MTATVEALANFEELAANPYPGRGLVVGITATGNIAEVYWVMGRSESSRNRVLVEEGGVVRTDVLDESSVTPEQLELIKYNAMKSVGSRHIVSNGNQTDDLEAGTRYGESFKDILGTWSYEPDAPNFTPRISGIIDSGFAAGYELSVISKSPGDDEPIRTFYRSKLWGRTEGLGRGIHTYLGDGSPLPAFDKEPIDLPLGEGADDTAEMYWQMLNEENRVALVVKEIDAQTGEIRHRIINKIEE